MSRAWIALIASVIVIVFSVVFGSKLRGDEDDGSAYEPPRTPSASATPSITPPSSEPTATASTPDQEWSAPAMPTEVPSGFSSVGVAPLPALPGLQGKGGNASLPKIRVRLEVSSSKPIGVVGYQVPTSLTHPSGTIRDVGTHWSLDTIAYGQPDYARLFFSAGPGGEPVTCVITINGKVTERRSTDGPYGRTMCQG